MKVVILPSDGGSDAMLGRLVEAVDEEFGESAEFVLIAAGNREIAGHPLIRHRFDISIYDFLKKLLGIFGSAERTSNPQLPGLTGAVEIAPETLRNWEEDIEVLHSLILETSSSEDLDARAFLRGMPPAWHDLAANLDVPRSIAPELLNDINSRFDAGPARLVVHGKGKILQLPTVGAKLAKLFPGEVPLFRHFRFTNLTELIRSYGDFEVVWEAPRWIVVRR